MRAPHLLMVALAALVVVDSARGGTVTWVPDADGLWTTAANWSSTPALPGSGDDVVINVAGDRTITLSSGTQSIKSLSSGEQILISGSVDTVLQVLTTAQLNNTLTMTSGTLLGGTYNMSGASSILALGGTFDGGVTMNGPVNVSGNPGQLTVYGGMTLNNTMSIGDVAGTLYGRVNFGSPGKVGGTLAGTGTVVLGGYGSSNTITNNSDQAGAAAALTIGSGITVRGKSGQILNQYANGTILNQGTISADVSGGIIVLGSSSNGTVTNQGTFSALNGGQLNINGAWSGAAGSSIIAGAGSTLNLGNSLNPWSNAGTITATNATVNLNGTFTQAGMGTFNRTGGTVNLNGPVTGDLALTAATGSWNMNSSGSLKNGTYSASGGASLTVITGSFNNVIANGPVNVSGNVGQLTVIGGLTLNDVMGVGDAAGTTAGRVNFGAASNASGTLAGTGSVVFGGAGGGINTLSNNTNLTGAGGPLTIASGMTVRGKNGQIVNNFATGTIINQGTISADVSLGTIQVGGSSGTFTNQGTLSALNGGTLSVNGSWSGAAGSTLTAGAGSALNLGSGTVAWSNAGTVTANNATVNLGGSFTQANLGTFSRTGGTVNIVGQLNGNLALSPATGNWNLASSGILQNGTYTASGGASLTVLNGTFVNVTANGPVNVSGNAGQLTALGGLTLNNTLSIGDQPGTTYGRVYIGKSGVAAGTLSGSGTIVFGGNLINNTLYNNSNQADAAGTLTIANGMTVRGKNGQVINNYTSGTIINQGTISADVSGGTIQVGNDTAGTFQNQGTLSALNGGTLNVYGPWSNSAGANITAGAGSTLNLGSGTTPWSNAGTITATNATVNLGGTFAQADLGTINRSGGTVNIIGTVNGNLALSAATGNLIMGSSASLQNGTYTASGGAALTLTGGTFVNVTANGPVNVNGSAATGVLNVTGGLTLNDTLNIGDAGTTTYGRVNFGQFGSPAGALSGTGTVLLGGNGNNSLLNNSNQTGAAGTLTIGSGITIHGNKGQIVNVNSTGTILNQGTISADVPGGMVNFGSAPGSVVNQGTLAADGGTFIVDGTFSNSGLLRVTAGTFQISNTTNLILLPGSNLVVTGGTAQLDRDFTQQPKFDLPGGTLTGSGNFSTPTLNWTGGTMSGSGKTTVTPGTMTISGTGTKTLARTIDNSGAAEWTDGQILVTNGTYNNLATGVFNASANNSFFASGGTNAFNNAGAFSKTSSSITIFSTPFNNQAGGTVNVNDGTLVLSGGGVNSGSIEIAAGATARFGGNFVHAAGSTLTSHGNVDFNVATVSLDGNVTIDGDLSFNSAAATVKANATANKLALVNSTATVAAGGVLSVGPGGIAFGGAAANTVTLQAAAGAPGKLLLGGDVAFTGTDGTAGLNTGDVAVTQSAGLLDLGGATRTFSVNDGLAAVDLAVSAKIANGSIVKGGAGTLRLDSPNAYAGGTKVSAGTLEAIDPAALGSGPVTLSDATLSLRSDAAAPPSFASDVTVNGDATIRVDRISVGTSGVLKLGTVSVGGTRLGVGGANRSLEVAGLALSATPTLDVSVPLVINGPVSQTAAGLGFTKSTGTSKLTLAGTTANTYTGVTRVNAGTLELNKPEGVVAVPGDLQVFGGTVKQLAGGQIAASSNVTVANVGSLLDLGGHAQTLASLNVTGGSVNVGTSGINGSTGQALLRVNGAFSVTGGGKLDLANNRLVVDYDPAAASPITSVRAALLSAYANGVWNGPGIASVGITAGRSLGYAEANDVLGAAGGSFGSATVDGSAVLVRYTLSGDATLDGTVDFNDLVKLAQNYNTTVPTTGSAWYRGDFNYDGTVEFNDLVKLAQNYNAALPSKPIAGAPADFATDLAAAFASVPEPGAVSLLLAGAVLTGRRRRRPL